jgi:hypothetical protein
VNPLPELRKGIMSVLSADAPLIALVGTNLAFRPRRALTAFPALTFFDFGTVPDPLAPLLDRTYQFDGWGVTLADAEAVRERVRVVLDRRPALITAMAAVGIRVRAFYWTSDSTLPEQDAEVEHTVSEYRCLAYYPPA